MSNAATKSQVDDVGPGTFQQRSVLELPFDQYQRYRLIQESIESIRWNPRLTVLDVSESPPLLDRFLPNDTVVVADITAGGSESFANGISLAFDDAAFDVVVTSETLLHVPPNQRHNFLAELTRVAREAVIIGAPFDDPAVVQSEEVFRSLIWARYGEGQHLIDAHRRYGLPSLDQTEAFFHSEGLQTTVLPNGYLHRWLVGISTFFLLQWRFDDSELNARANTYYNSNFYKADNREPSYRKILIATRKRDISGVRAKLCSESGMSGADELFHLQILNLMVQVLTEGWSSRALERDRAVQILNAQLREKREKSELLIAQVGERQSAVESLGAQLAERHERVIALTEHVAERQRAIESLMGQLSEEEQSAAAFSAQTAEKEQAFQALTSRLDESELAKQSLSAKLVEANQANQVLLQEFSEREQNLLTVGLEKDQAIKALSAQLEKITNSSGWLLLSRYGRFKHRYLLPAYRLLHLAPDEAKER